MRGDLARVDGVHIAPRGEDLQLPTARAAPLGGRDEAPAHPEGAVVELLRDAAETGVDLVQRQLKDSTQRIGLPRARPEDSLQLACGRLRGEALCQHRRDELATALGQLVDQHRGRLRGADLGLQLGEEALLGIAVVACEGVQQRRHRAVG